MINYYSHHAMDSRHITVTHACMISLFLPYGSPFIVHVLLFHVTVFMVYDCFLLLIWIFPLLDMSAVDMRCVELRATWIQVTGATSRISHLLFSVFRYLVVCYQQSSGSIIILHVPCTILVLAMLCTLTIIKITWR